jgi:hypothetical protein
MLVTFSFDRILLTALTFQVLYRVEEQDLMVLLLQPTITLDLVALRVSCICS